MIERFLNLPPQTYTNNNKKTQLQKTINDPKCKYPIKFSKNKISVQGSNKDFSSWKKQKARNNIIKKQKR